MIRLTAGNPLNLKAGDRIYYTGDMANESSWATVEAVSPLDVALRFDNNRGTHHVTPQAFGDKYAGHCNPRFVTKAAYDAYQNMCKEAIQRTTK